MKLQHSSALLSILLLCTASTCNSSLKHQAGILKETETKEKIDGVKNEIDEKGKAYVFGTGLALDRETNASPAVKIAKEFNDKAQVILGPPKVADAAEMQKIVGGLLSEQKKEREDARKREEKLIGEVAILNLEREKLRVELDKIQIQQAKDNAENAEKAQKWDELQRKNFLKRFWGWLTATLGVGGIVALIIFFPALLPVVARMFAWAIGKVPALAGAIGVAGTKVFDGVVKGVGRVRTELKLEEKLPLEQQKKYTAAEVRQMLDDHLLKATDEEHRKLIEARRKAIGADSVA